MNKKNDRMNSIKGYEDEYIEAYKKWISFLENHNQIIDVSIFNKEFPEAKYNESKFTFVYDGILDKKEWDKQKNKVMFLLRESYDASKWYRISIDKINPQSGKNSHFFKNILLYKNAINKVLSNDSVIIDSPNYKEFVEWRNKKLNTIAYFNVKKFLGNPESNYKDIIRHVEDTKHSNGDSFKGLLKQHIDMIDPDVIYCDDITYSAYKRVYDIDNYIGKGKVLFKKELIGKKYFPKLYKHDYRTKDGRIKSRFLVRFYHPSYFKKDTELYKRLLKGMINPLTDNGKINLYNEFHNS